MTSQNFSTLVSLDNIKAEVERSLRVVGLIKDSQTPSVFNIHWDKMKDGLIPIDGTLITEREVITIDLNG